MNNNKNFYAIAVFNDEKIKGIVKFSENINNRVKIDINIIYKQYIS